MHLLLLPPPELSVTSYAFAVNRGHLAFDYALLRTKLTFTGVKL